MRAAIFISFLAAAAFGGAAAWYAFDTSGESQNGFTQFTSLATTTEHAPRVPPKGAKEFRSDMYRFSLFYPDYLRVRDEAEIEGARTFVFEDGDGRGVFQIFVVPYAETEITKDRLALDNPSGVMRETQEVSLGDGTRALIFYSRAPVIGETREVWLVKHGYLYEVTAPKNLDPFIAEVMASWQFLF